MATILSFVCVNDKNAVVRATLKLRSGGADIADVQSVLREAAGSVTTTDDETSTGDDATIRNRTRQLYIEWCAAIGALTKVTTAAQYNK